MDHHIKRQISPLLIGPAEQDSHSKNQDRPKGEQPAEGHARKVPALMIQYKQHPVQKRRRPESPGFSLDVEKASTEGQLLQYSGLNGDYNHRPGKDRLGIQQSPEYPDRVQECRRPAQQAKTGQPGKGPLKKRLAPIRRKSQGKHRERPYKPLHCHIHEPLARETTLYKSPQDPLDRKQSNGTYSFGVLTILQADQLFSVLTTKS